MKHLALILVATVVALNAYSSNYLKEYQYGHENDILPNNGLIINIRQNTGGNSGNAETLMRILISDNPSRRLADAAIRSRVCILGQGMAEDDYQE